MPAARRQQQGLLAREIHKNRTVACMCVLQNSHLYGFKASGEEVVQAVVYVKGNLEDVADALQEPRDGHGDDDVIIRRIDGGDGGRHSNCG